MKEILIKMAQLIYRKFFKNDSLVKYQHGFRFYSNTHIDSLTPQFVEIGDNFISAPGSLITAHDASTFLFSGKYRIEKVIIGDNVFLGANSVVLPGVKIGDNVIVGAGAVVTKDLASNGVYIGNPARYISSIEDYLKKCSDRNILFEPPQELIDEYKMGKRFSMQSIKRFQEKAYTESLIEGSNVAKFEK